MTINMSALWTRPTNAQFIYRQLPIAISLLLVIACAYTLAQVTWMFFPEPETDQATVARPSTPGNKPVSQQQSIRQLTAAHLFGEANKTAAQTAAKAPVTRLNLALKGVLASTPESRASAIIAQGKNGKEDIYSIGDKIQNGVSIKEIHPEHVILDRQGRLEKLELLKESVGKGLQGLDLPVQTSSASTPEAALKEIRKTILRNPTSFGDYALPVVVKEDGKQVGYRLQPQKKGQVLSQLGIQPTDVITAINGIKLDKPQNGIGALRKLSNASEINLTVKRNGAEVPLSIQVQ